MLEIFFFNLSMCLSVYVCHIMNVGTFSGLKRNLALLEQLKMFESYLI